MKQKKFSLKTKPLWSIAFLIGGITLLFYFIQESNKSKLIDKCPRYTIAYSTTITRKNVNYRYQISNQNYTGTWTVNPRNLKEFINFNLYPKDFIGHSFLLRVNCDKPELSEIDWTHSIPASVTNAPIEGWKEIPESFPKTEFSD